mmetsp:Transcript_28730/g.77352  ORF Transcript_28730/g.77352 Transcript_28730/m.77352 type:complete len:596 (-) Transcript_28730:17-1804(-)
MHNLLLVLVGLLELGDDVLLDVRRDELVLGELHRIVGAALRHGAQLRHVLEHVAERDESLDRLRVATLAELHHHSAAGGDVADHVAHVLLRGGHVHLHERLHQAATTLAEALASGHAARDLERHDRRIDVVVRAVNEGRLHAEHREAGDRAGREHRLDALLHARDVLLRHNAALDLLRKLEVGLGGVLRLEDHLNTRELARTTRLLLVGVVDLGLLGDGLTVGDLRRALVALDVELTAHAVHNDLKVELAHALDNGLARLLIARETERRVLGSKADECFPHLLLVTLGLGLNGDLDDRLGEVHLLENHSVILEAEGLASGGVLKTAEGHDVASAGLLDLGTVVGVHLKHAAHALVLLLDRVKHGGASGENARVDAGEGEGANERVGGDLERKGGERLVVVRLALHLLLAGDVGALNGRNISRRRHVVVHGVKERLNALVLERGAGEHRHEGASEGTNAKALDELLGGGLNAVEVLHEHLLVLLHGKLDELGTVLVDLVLELVEAVPLRKRGLGERGAVLAGVRTDPLDGLHLDEVDHAGEVLLGANGQLEDGRRGIEHGFDHGDAVVEVGAGAVHLVHEAHARDAVLVRLAPHGP